MQQRCSYRARWLSECSPSRYQKHRVVGLFGPDSHGVGHRKVKMLLTPTYFMDVIGRSGSCGLDPSSSAAAEAAEAVQEGGATLVN